ncbi:MAG: 50S ribosomal protein L22 [Proteobacteria bacterium]|nr:MAG: 50S ribosomal protein L22 [Pseudomonadota bacterium]
MERSYKAVLRDIRVTPRKARLVTDLIRGKPVSVALDMLKATQKKTAPLLAKLIQSAMANATSTSTVDVDRLVVAFVYVDEGQKLKRFLPRAQGRATQVKKRSSHITVKLAEI